MQIFIALNIPLRNIFSHDTLNEPILNQHMALPITFLYSGRNTCILFLYLIHSLKLFCLIALLLLVELLVVLIFRIMNLLFICYKLDKYYFYIKQLCQQTFIY